MTWMMVIRCRTSYSATALFRYRSIHLEWRVVWNNNNVRLSLSICGNNKLFYWILYANVEHYIPPVKMICYKQNIFGSFSVNFYMKLNCRDCLFDRCPSARLKQLCTLVEKPEVVASKHNCELTFTTEFFHQIMYSLMHNPSITY